MSISADLLTQDAPAPPGKGGLIDFAIASKSVRIDGLALS
jgi:hypothetical protein